MCLEILRIELKKNSSLAKIESFYGDGSRDEKGMAYRDLIEILNDSTSGSGYQNIAELPGGCLRGAVDITDMSTFFVAIKLAQEKRILPFYGEEHIVPFPELLFLFKVKKGKTISSQVYALADARGGKMIAHYPFGNVYENGAICWGRNTLPILNNIKETEKLVGLFLGSETNNDLYSVGKNVSKKEFTNQKGLILQAVNRKKYPSSWLVVTGDTMQKKVNQFFAETERIDRDEHRYI